VTSDVVGAHGAGAPVPLSPADAGSARRPLGAPVEITLRDLLRVARRRWFLIGFTTFLLSSAVAYVTYFVLTPIYRSTAVVLIKPGREIAYSLELGSRPVAPRQLDTVVMADLEILHSEDLLRDVVATLGATRLYPEPDAHGLVALRNAALRKLRTWLLLPSGGRSDPLHAAVRQFRGAFTAAAVPGAEVIRISFQHADPQLAAEAVNQVVDRFKEHHLRAYSEPLSKGFLEQNVVRYQHELVRVEERLRALEEEHPVLAVENPAQALEQERAQLALALKQVRNEVAALNKRVAYLQNHESSLPRTSRLREELAVQITAGIADAHAQVARERGLEEQLATLEDALRELPTQMNAYRSLLRERDYVERRFRVYAESFEGAVISEEMDRQKIANLSVIQRARPASVPSRPKKLLNLLVGAGLGLGLGLGLAFLRDGLGKASEGDA
jgi:uncharacterized protein involved in exopolysaccharide biosynthesis